MQAVEKLADLVGRISIEDYSDGTAIELDNVALPPDPSNRDITADPGPHTVTAQKAGYASRRLEVTVMSGATSRIHLDLQPIETPLTVDCQGVPATVLIDDAPVGECPFSTRMRPGEYRLRVESEGRLPWHREVTLQAQTPMHLDVVLSPTVVPASAAPPTRPRAPRSS